MSSGDRCLMVHGHFYQPPRENPWTGAIDPQHSAHPWENWNSRIAEECYLPMARSRVTNAKGETVDLHNNYARASFNFGPTLLSWLAERHPGFIGHLRAAAGDGRSHALAQAYSHMMLPLADARDRHTQIVWGLAEFRRRFGFDAEGMWLPECGIDRETARALADHGVKFVILSPHQASSIRPFGEAAWRDASMGTVDTRRAYRLFETDGGGRTHFERWLDVVFYTPGLNLKVSFDHILSRPDDLARELESCYLPDYPGAQLVSIVTDGEIYGHHEKGGEEALSRLFRETAPRLGLKICSAREFIRDNPPTWEVRLWQGEDGRGSSWSCRHGMGRWSHDCGCAPPTRPGWRQDWRRPLRAAFDALRDKVREAARRELGPLLWDLDDARNGYAAVLLDPGPETRLAFIRRHARRPLAAAETETLWRLMEALRHAMLMYTSCGWFFDEISGLEPVQNMRYALRAAELAQPFRSDDLAAGLAGSLADAASNLPRFGDGRGVFRELVLPTRRANRELAAAMAACLALDLPTDSLSWRIVDRGERRERPGEGNARSVSGSFVCLDAVLDRFIRADWAARTDESGDIVVRLGRYEEAQGDPARGPGDIPFRAESGDAWPEEPAWLPARGTNGRFGDSIFVADNFPVSVRSRIYRRFSSRRERELLRDAVRAGVEAAPLLERARRHGAIVPGPIQRTADNAFELGILNAGLEAMERMHFGPAAEEAALASVRAAAELDLLPSVEAASRALRLAARELLHWLAVLSERNRNGVRDVVLLPDGGTWLAPSAPCNRHLAFPEAEIPALALGKGLALLAERLAGEADPAVAALRLLPLPELLAFMRNTGLRGGGDAAPGMEYWEFLGRPLARLVVPDPAGIMAGEPGDRVRAIGSELGFDSDAVEKRIAAALRMEAEGWSGGACGESDIPLSPRRNHT